MSGNLTRDEASDVNIQGNSIWNNSGSNTGIHIKNARAKIRGNLLFANLGNAITVEGDGEVEVGFNNIIENQDFGLQNLNPSITIDATYNWWADSTGPGGSGPGLGDKVSDGVDYSNWMTEMISVFAAAESDTVLVPLGQSDSVTLVFENWGQVSDNLIVTLNDDLGWILNVSPFQVPVPKYPQELSQVYFDIPADAPKDVFDAVTINAQSQANSEDTFTSSFVIHAQKPMAVSISISPDTVEVTAGNSLQFAVDSYDQFGRPFDAFEWTATGGEIDADGLFIAANADGTFTVTATDSISGLSATAQVQISGATPTSLNPEEQKDDHLLTYPNPFNNSTIFKFSLEEASRLCLKIYGFSGKEIEILANGQFQVGVHEIIWSPNKLRKGIYIGELTVFSNTQKPGIKYSKVNRIIYR